MELKFNRINNPERSRIFVDKNVIITGGLGFIGSNPVYELVRLKAKGLIVNSLSGSCSCNIFDKK